MLKFFKKNLSSKYLSEKNNLQYYMYDLSHPTWMPREYYKFADEAYSKNVIANRCINMIAQSAASVNWQLHKIDNDKKTIIKNHPLLKLLKKPNNIYGGTEFFENILAYKMISGNVYVLAINNNSNIQELHLLRPDRITIVPGKTLVPDGYIYQPEGGEKIFYPVNRISGKCDILHLRNFNPLDDYYGLSQIEAAAYSIDQHNQAAKWNQSLLQNGARPSGAMIIKSDKDGFGGSLSDSQFSRLKEQVDECFSGSNNAGRPMLLEGGLEWKEMSLSPRDMDFIEAKNSSARDIALAFGVPPQLLGIPGDNTYSNMQEARVSLWEETILPMLEHLQDAFNSWLVPFYGKDYVISYDQDSISVLTNKRQSVWQRIEQANFMTINEKRTLVGLSPIENGDKII